MYSRAGRDPSNLDPLYMCFCSPFRVTHPMSRNPTMSQNTPAHDPSGLLYSLNDLLRIRENIDLQTPKLEELSIDAGAGRSSSSTDKSTVTTGDGTQREAAREPTSTGGPR